MAGETLEQVEVRSQADLLDWLAQNHTQSESVWLVRFKKSVPQFYVTQEDVLSAILRYGWVDSLVRKKDDQRSMLLISPRKPNSAWSALNKRVIEQLSRDGLMHPAGQAMVDLAKTNGQWDILNDVEDGIVPDDLAMELAKYKNASAHFDAFPKSAKRGILEWIKQAKRSQTRTKRIAETAQLADLNERALDWRSKQKRL